jgi:hypothetical protein
MKKVSTVAAKSKKMSQQKVTVGLDLGDRRKKDDRLDAQTLARLARIDPKLLIR